ncbi:DeoR/GlpR family DNA-binding transcription regulator [Pasteurellaceae bacterium LIM206]|nr:DeoR/GlpR family DNA-binding transcription regulator [Pasteurellaceae bacterium LIM206]
MVQNERENQILTLLKEQGYVDNLELSRKLECSTVTIRTAMRNLEKQGLIARTHGGAQLVANTLTLSLSAGNIFKNNENKRKIAQQAYTYINERDTIILDDSSNSFYLAQLIKEKKDKSLIVITNSLAIACELSGCDKTEVVLIGGLLGGGLPATMGETALNTLRQFKADKGFIGVYGINPQIGITSIGHDQMLIKRLILEQAQEVYVLVGSEKFGDSCLSVAAPLSKVHRIITDRNIPAEYQRVTREQTLLDIV